ncbi:MAG: carbamate kinase [Alphaproteobacteria bacterium]|nr:carbamate kinase [Alphaproteobacteria bacterium]
MRIVIALGGNALLKRGEPQTADHQRTNVRTAAQALAKIVDAGHSIIVSHGNGPQVGLLALQTAAYSGAEAYPLDILDAESEGMIGYLIEQELRNQLGSDALIATLLTQVEIDPKDPAFRSPSKPIGPVYNALHAEVEAANHGWSIAPDGDGFRRVVASPSPKCILEEQVIRFLVDQGVIVICAGGGGIPVAKKADGGFIGVEAVIDKDRASALLAETVGADALLMLTDVDAVYTSFGTDNAKPINTASPDDLKAENFATGSMGPKVEAACSFVGRTGGQAGIGRLEDALAILEGKAGTVVRA